MPKYVEPRERTEKRPKHNSLIALKRQLADVERRKLTASKEVYMTLCEEASFLKNKMVEKPVRG